MVPSLQWQHLRLCDLMSAQMKAGAKNKEIWPQESNINVG
jgi:hypothetical protein